MFTRQELFILQGALMQRIVEANETLETIKDSGATKLIATTKKGIANLNTLRDKVRKELSVNTLKSKTMEHVITDCESNRTFCLFVENGALVGLQELHAAGRDSRWVDVDKLSSDGGDWWEQWEGEVKAGRFNRKSHDPNPCVDTSCLNR